MLKEEKMDMEMADIYTESVDAERLSEEYAEEQQFAEP